MLLSVIIPIYNKEQYIEKCLESILSQSMSEFEVICINDGSTDSTLNKLSKYQANDSRVTIINQKNSGVASARNAGVKHATGQYISFIDPDDYISDGMFKHLTSLFEVSPEIDVVGCGTHVIYEAWQNYQKSDDLYYKVNTEENIIVTEDVFKRINASCCNKIFKRELIQKYDIHYPANSLYEDAAFFWCYLGICRRASFVATPYYNYIRYANSTMGKTFSKSNSRAIDHLKITEHLYNFYKENDLLKVYSRIFLYLYSQNLHFSLNYSPFSKKIPCAIEGYRILTEILEDPHINMSFKRKYRVGFTNKATLALFIIAFIFSAIKRKIIRHLKKYVSTNDSKRQT